MYTFRSDSKGRYFISLAAFVVTVIILAALNVLRSYVHDKYPQYLPDMTIVKSLPEKVIGIIMIVLAALYLITIIIILPLWYGTLRYVIDKGKIISYTGLISRTYSIMRISSIQHATVLSTPLSKFTSFNFISLNALGGNILMFFLSDEDCRKVLQMIKEYRFPEEKQRSAAKEAEPIIPADFKYGTLSFDGYYTVDSDIFTQDDSMQMSMFDSGSQLSFDSIFNSDKNDGDI